MVNNILKHANATKVMFQMYQLNNQLIVQLEDNGKGFDFETMKSGGSLGLLNILSRANNINAQFHSERGIPNGVISTLRLSL